MLNIEYHGLAAYIPWIIAPVLAVLWRLGGSGTPPLGLNWRRILAPITVALWAFMMGKAWYLALGAGLAIAIASRLPITLIGSDPKNAGQHWWWMPINGLAISSPIFILGFPDRVDIGLVCMMLSAIFYYVGFHMVVKDSPQWRSHLIIDWGKWEFGFGLILGACLAWTVAGGFL